MQREDITSKSSENCMSGKLGCLCFLDFFELLNAGLDESSTSKTSFPTLDANGMRDELFQKHYPSQMKSSNVLNRFMNHKSLKQEHFFSNLKQSYGHDRKKNKEKPICETFKTINGKELIVLYLKDDVNYSQFKHLHLV